MTSQDGDDHTRNHGYNTPPEGATDWHLDLNQNFDQIDTDVEIRDTEGNKGDYEPKEGAKYEATDSGAVYYGNGSSWVLADREVKSLRAESVNSVLTPQDNTIRAIQELIDSYRNPDIVLKPGVVYEGDTQLVIDTSPDNGPFQGKDRQVRIHAQGAGVNYTGAKKSAVQILQGDVYNTSVGDASAFGGNTTITQGTWSGPGTSVSNSAAIRVDDCFGATIAPTEVGDAEHGVLFVNNGAWNEGHLCEISRFGRSELLTVAKPKYLVRFAGGESSFPDAGANGGGPSFRNSEVRIWFGKAANDEGGATFFQDHASTHGAKHVIRGFLPRGGTGYKLVSEAAINRFCQVHFECEGGDSNSTGIDVKNANGKPLFLAARIQSDGVDVKGNITRIDQNGWKSDHPFEIVRNSDRGFDNTWIRMNDPDNPADTLYEVTNRDDSFALKHYNDSFVGSFNSNNDYAAFRGNEFQAKTSDGSLRSFKGVFEQHPSTDNGDVWYVTGSGDVEEGFYGMTSNGVVKFG